MRQAHTRPTICIDLGKTRCRVALIDDSEVLSSVDGPGVAGAAAADGAHTISQLLVAQITRLDGVDSAIAVGVGAAGTLTDPAAGASISAELARVLGIPVAVTSDIVSAHVGALGGAAGVALVAGTGAVALGLSESGELHRVDGWGPELGDLGGGSWIGREGIRAALLADVGIAPRTVLQAALVGLIEPEQDAARWLATTTGSTNVGGLLARFAPSVLEAAAGGDPAALDIIARAVDHLSTTADAARRVSGTEATLVSVLGGLTGSPFFASALDAGLRTRGLGPVAPIGTALDGAHIIAHSNQLPHERYIHRAQ